MKCSGTFDWIVFTLVVLGAINWGLVGVFDFNIVTAALGGYEKVVQALYTLIGVSGLMVALRCYKKK